MENYSNETCIFDYLEIFKMEYQLEINKKHALENRVNFVLTFFAAFGVAIFDRIDFIFFRNLNCIRFNDIISIVIIIYFFWVLNKLFSIIKGRKLPNFGVIESFDSEILKKKKIEETEQIINDYRQIVLERRKINEKNTELFNETLKKILIMIILTFFHKILST